MRPRLAWTWPSRNWGNDPRKGPCRAARSQRTGEHAAAESTCAIRNAVGKPENLIHASVALSWNLFEKPGVSKADAGGMVEKAAAWVGGLGVQFAPRSTLYSHAASARRSAGTIVSAPEIPCRITDMKENEKAQSRDGREPCSFVHWFIWECASKLLESSG